MTTFDQSKFDFTSGTTVCSRAQKFIVPVGNYGNKGEPLVHPAGTVKDGEDISGQPIVDYKGRPIGESGIVFGNPVDGATQAAPGDGESIIILNEVTVEQAETIARKVAEYAEDPMDLTLDQLKSVLRFAAEELGLGDQYNSKREFAEKNLSPVNANEQEVNPYYGHKKRDERDLCSAYYVPGQFEFEGPAATPQQFQNGGVVLQHGDSVRGVQTAEFQRTYMLAGGGVINDAREQLANYTAAS